MSNLVGAPEDWFSCVMAHLVVDIGPDMMSDASTCGLTPVWLMI